MVTDGWGPLGWAAAAVFLLVVVRWGDRDTIRALWGGHQELDQ